MDFKRKKVLFVDLTGFYGGGQKFLKIISQELTQKIEPFFVVANEKIYEQILSENKFFLKKGIFSQILFINHLIKKENIEIVLLNGNRPIYFAPFLKCNYKIAYKHTSNNALSGIRKIIGVPLLHFCYYFCDRLVLLFSEARRDVFFVKKRTVIINNGIEIKETEKVNRIKNKVTFICVTRLDKNKGLEWLILNFLQTFPVENDVELLIAGEGPLKNRLLDIISKTEANNVSLLGFINNIEELLLASDVFILPSEFESFPLSILEAMKCNLPIIATNTGGVSEMVNTENGFLIRYMTDTDLQNAMKTLYLDKSKRIAQGNRSAEIVKHKFNIKDSIKKIESLICNLDLK